MGYFRELPDVNYQSFLQKRKSSLEYLKVKNLFRRVKLRDDLQNVFTLFNKYVIEEGERPDTIAEKLYGSSDLDWVVMLTAGIINARDDWPLSDKDIYQFTEDKYGLKNVNAVKFYETREVRDSKGRLILPAGKVVDNDFTITYFDGSDEIVVDQEIFDGEITFVSTTYNDLPVRGYLYYPTTSNLGVKLDVVILYHPTIGQAGITPFNSAQRFLNTFLDQSSLNIKDKIVFSVAYPQDAIPIWDSNPSLPGQQFPGIDYPNFYFGDNLPYAEAALLWVKNELNTYFENFNIPKVISKVYTFGHSQGGSLVHKLNTIYEIDGVISNAPGPIDLLTACSISELSNDINISCKKIKDDKGSTTQNPSFYNSVSLKDYLSETKSPTLFTQALDDVTGNNLGSPQVFNMQTIMEPGLNSCTNCASFEFKYYESGGHAAFETNEQLQEDIRTFIGSLSKAQGTPFGKIVTVNPVIGVTNYVYEVRKNNEKRTIYVLRPEYLQQYLNDMRDIMFYDESSQYVDPRLIKTENTRNTSP